MSLFSHVTTLESKHQKLDYAIVNEARRPLPDFTYITMLKKQKLIIKEELERLSKMLEDMPTAGNA